MNSQEIVIDSRDLNYSQDKAARKKFMNSEENDQSHDFMSSNENQLNLGQSCSSLDNI